MISLRRARDARVTNIRAEGDGSTHRISADVDGDLLWFESDDTELSAAPEAFGSALLLASIHHGRHLVIDAPVSGAWLKNIERLFPIWRDWWGYEGVLPTVASMIDDVSAAIPAKALMFSGGVDSFYSILKGEQHDFLISGHGLDIPLSDASRMARLRYSLMKVSDAVGAQPIVIRTNFREHPAAGRGPLWERIHGGVLAAYGHLLRERVGQLTISSSYGIKTPVPWGSSWMTDPFFSSDRVRIAQYGYEVRREEKIPEIANDPLVQAHLRVCWENRNDSSNCSQCGKCLMTMVSLAEAGVLGEFSGVFDSEDALINRLNATTFLWKHTRPMERAAKRGKLDPRLADAAGRLVKRSRNPRRLREFATRLTYLVDRYV